MAVKRMGTLGVSVRKMKALPVMMETETLIGKDRRNLTCFVHQLILVVKYILLADI